MWREGIDYFLDVSWTSSPERPWPQIDDDDDDNDEKKSKKKEFTRELALEM